MNVAVRGGTIVWDEWDNSPTSSLDYVVKAASVSTMATAVVSTTPTTLRDRYRFVTEGQNLYWVNAGQIHRRHWPTGAIADVASNAIADITDFAVDAAYAYACTFDVNGNLDVMRLALIGGTWVRLAHQPASGVQRPARLLGAAPHIVVDSFFVYWTNPDLHAVYRTTLIGGPVVTVATVSSTPTSIAVDATSLYVADIDANVIVRITPK